MAGTDLFSWRPAHTPPLIQAISLLICLVSMLSAAFQSIFNEFAIPYGPQALLSLSSWGIHNGFIWQFISFLFVQDTYGGLSFSFFLTLFLNVYFFWVIAPLVLEIIDRGPFLRLCTACGVLSGLCALLFMDLMGQDLLLAGIAPVTLALLLVWSMAYPDTEVFLFSLVPVKAKWLSVITIGIFLLSAISRWDLPGFVLYFSSPLIAYFYATCAWHWTSPFAWTASIDKKLADLGTLIRQYALKILPFKTNNHDKVIDIGTGKSQLDDDAFVDKMLGKIFKEGEHSLSWSERVRLQEISKKKNQNKRN